MDFEGIQTIFHIIPYWLAIGMMPFAAVRRWNDIIERPPLVIVAISYNMLHSVHLHSLHNAHSQAALKQKYFARRIGQQMHFSNFRPHLINGSRKIYFFALDKPGWKVFDISLPGHIFICPRTVSLEEILVSLI